MINVSIVIPAFNEEASIYSVLSQLDEIARNELDQYELIVVDDASLDGTVSEAKKLVNAKIIQHSHNRGYGSSLKSGIRNAEFENILIIDADGTYPVSSIPLMLKELKDCDMVVASRTGNFVKIPIIRRPAKWFIKKLSEYVTSSPIEDLNSGLRCFRKKAATNYLHLLPDGFSFTTTLTVAMLSDGYEIRYKPIDYLERKGKSKIRALDFINFTNLIIRLSAYFNPLKIFFPIGFVLIVFSFLKFSFDLYLVFEELGGISSDIMRTKTVSSTTILLFISGLQIILFGLMSDALIKRQK